MADIERYNKKVEQRSLQPERALVPEGIDSLKHVMDQAQTVLETAYGLQDLTLIKASNFLYPEVTSSMAEHNLAVEPWTDAGFFVTDADTKEGISQWVRKLLLRKQAFRESLGLPRNPHIDQNLGVTPTQSPRSGLIPRFSLPSFGLTRLWHRTQDESPQAQFLALHPVIYLGPEIISQTKGVGDISQMLTPDSYHALDTITEEMGHFLYTQVQFLVYREHPGAIIAEGVALIDNYQVLKRACEILGQNIFDPDNPLTTDVVSQFVGKISDRGELAHRVFAAGGYHPTASKYTKSVKVMSGFIKHIITKDQKGQDTDQELYDFYRMTGPQKGRHLRDLYGRYVESGDNSYEQPLSQVTNIIEFEIEFEDEELWKEKYEAAKAAGIAMSWLESF